MKKILAGVAVLFLVVFVLVLVLAQPIFFRPAKRPVPTVEAARLRTHVVNLSERFSPRSVENPQNLQQAARYIAEEFTRGGSTVSEQPYQVEGRLYRNVIARFGPESAERIVVGAHYDAFGGLPG